MKRRVFIGLLAVMALVVAGCVGLLMSIGGGGESAQERWDRVVEESRLTDERLEQLPDSEQTKVARWQERSKVHNPNLTTIERQLQAVGADRVIDGEEHVYLCSVQQQWEQQLTALLAYIDDYEQVEPEFVAANQAMFTAWEQDARSTQEVVLEIGPTCP